MYHYGRGEGSSVLGEGELEEGTFYLWVPMEGGGEGLSRLERLSSAILKMVRGIQFIIEIDLFESGRGRTFNSTRFDFYQLTPSPLKYLVNFLLRC